MRKNYQTPSLKVLYLDAAPLLQSASDLEKSETQLDASEGYVGLSKQFWGGSVLDDDANSADE